MAKARTKAPQGKKQADDTGTGEAGYTNTGEAGYTSTGEAGYTGRGQAALKADAAIPPADRVITPEKLELIGAAGSMPHEAGAWFGLSAKDFTARLKAMDLSAFWNRAQARGRVHLRLSQFRLVETSPSMALHLGKILLGQKGADDIEGGITLIVDTGIRRGDAPKD